MTTASNTAVVAEEVLPRPMDPLAVIMSVRHARADAEVLTPGDLRSIGLWGPIENREVAGFIGRYATQFAIPTTTDGPNLGHDYFLDAIRTHPTRVALLGREWPLSSTDGITIVELRPVPRFLWWVACRKDVRHPQLGPFLGLLKEAGHREGWLNFDSDRDWLPDADRADLLAWTAAASTRA